MCIRKLVIAFLMLLGLLVLSCAPAGAPAPEVKAVPPKEATPAAEASPKAIGPTTTTKPVGQAKYGGLLTLSTQSEPPSLDPHQEPTINTSVLVALAYNNLVEYDSLTGTTLGPGLAESWETTPDGKVYTFRLRRGVKWHDGKPSTTDDVVLSLQRIADPPKGVISNMSFMLKPVVDKVESPSPETVKVTLTRPFAPFLPAISFAYTPILPKHILEAKGNMKETVLGTGPFKLKSYDAGISFDVEKNKDYWVPGRPYLDGVRFYILKDASTRLAALRTARVLMTGRYAAALNPNEMDALKKTAPQVMYFLEPSLGGAWFCMNNKKEPFSDVRVRRAVSLIHDRQAAVKVVAQGAGTLGTVMPFAGWGLEEAELLKMPGFRQPKDADIAEAKKLMEEAGYGKGLKLTVYARTRRTSNEPALFFTSELSKIGIDAKVEIQEDVAFWDRARRGAFEACVYQPALAVPDPEWMSRYYVPGGGLNYAFNDDDKKLIEMWQKQQQLVDVKERQKVTKDVERYLLTDAVPGVLIVWFNTFNAYWPQVKNLAPGVSSYTNINLQEIWLDK